MEVLFEGFLAFFTTPGTWKMILMWAIGGVLIYLAIKKEMEPTLLLPIGFGAILMNFPAVVERVCLKCGARAEFGVKACEACNGEIAVHYSGIAEPLHTLYNAGIANELSPYFSLSVSEL